MARGLRCALSNSVESVKVARFGFGSDVGSCGNGGGAERTAAVGRSTLSDIRLLKVKVVLGIGGGTIGVGNARVIVDVAAEIAALSAHPVVDCPCLGVCNQH